MASRGLPALGVATLRRIQEDSIMGFSARVLADSISTAGHRLTTLEVTFPRIILAEFNTHRMFSRNSASSRAIPVEKMLAMVQENPYVPSHWGKNQKGMAAEEELSPPEQASARRLWLEARDSAVDHATSLRDYGLHKQLTNRLLEPFMWHTVIVTATEWSNFDNLRDHHAAHPEIRRITQLMKDARASSHPEFIPVDAWHLPLVTGIEIVRAGTNAWNIEDNHVTFFGRELSTKQVDWTTWAKISAARCARVSYMTHEGKRDLAEDLKLFGRLVGPGHMSPLEHPARPMTSDEAVLFHREELEWVGHGWKDTSRASWMLGNFNGWVQYRKLIRGESDILGIRL